MKSIKVKASATVANLACGFDVLGLCLDNPFDQIEIEIIPQPKVEIEILNSKYSDIPSNPEDNTGGVPALKIIKDYNLDFGFKIKILKGIPLSGGLGSSAATSAGVVFAINKLIHNKLSNKEMLKYALEGEKVSVTNPHADNIAPCLFGGLTLIRDTETLDIIHLSIKEYYMAIIHPHILINTEDARKILPDSIKLSSAIKQWGNLGALIYAFTSGDDALIKKSMQDYVIEPVRSTLIKGFDDIKAGALNLGALSCSISGSGPSIFALCSSESVASRILDYSKKYYTSSNLGCDIYLSRVNQDGPVIIN